MRYAKKSGYIYDISDFEEITIKRRPLTENELQKTMNKFLNKNELAECLKQLTALNPRLSFAMEFIALTGLRCGELLALRVQDYDKNNSSINVNATLISQSSAASRRKTSTHIARYCLTIEPNTL